MNKIEEYIVELKVRRQYLKENMPEYWPHEKLKERSVLKVVISKLEKILNEK